MKEPQYDVELNLKQGYNSPKKSSKLRLKNVRANDGTEEKGSSEYMRINSGRKQKIVIRSASARQLKEENLPSFRSRNSSNSKSAQRS